MTWQLAHFGRDAVIHVCVRVSACVSVWTQPAQSFQIIQRKELWDLDSELPVMYSMIASSQSELEICMHVISFSNVLCVMVEKNDQIFHNMQSFIFSNHVFHCIVYI